MTLDEAIKHAEEVANGMTAQGKCPECAEEHRQLAEWLKDYKRLLEQEPKYCDRNICTKNEYNGIGCDECEVTKSQEPTDENLHREREQAYMQGYEDASKRFRQEPCEDAISRQAVLDQTYLWSKDEFLRVTNPFDYLRKRINSLSPVTPQQKMGWWIKIQKFEKWKCSECGTAFRFTFKEHGYCPNCGAKMFEPQESEGVV